MENYQKMMETEFDKLEGRPRLLLQCCCGPCSSYVLQCLTERFLVTALFYNPNIRPAEEYQKRYLHLKKLIAQLPAKNPVDIWDCGYRPEDFDAVASGLESEPEGGARCVRCITLRLEETARTAAENGFDWFCTTLSVSPHKDARLINEAGRRLGEKYGVRFLPSDFKKKDGYLQSIRLSEKYGLYRQNYCGCGL